MAITVAVFSGGAYMGDRFLSSERDLGGRLQHWRDGIDCWTAGRLDLRQGPRPISAKLLLQRCRSQSSRELPDRDAQRRARPHAVWPRRDAGFGELLRMSQRVPIVPGGSYSVILDAHASEPLQLHLEICEQHLLYNEGCAAAAVMFAGDGSGVQRKVVSLDGRRLSGGPWYAPRLAFFAMAVESPGGHVEIDNVSLLGPDGREVLVNGNFAQGMARWFFTSERLHLPWHIKNIGLDLLFDQGLVGCCVSLCWSPWYLGVLSPATHAIIRRPPIWRRHLSGFLSWVSLTACLMCHA